MKARANACAVLGLFAIGFAANHWRRNLAEKLFVIQSLGNGEGDILVYTHAAFIHTKR